LKEKVSDFTSSIQATLWWNIERRLEGIRFSG
jgi:hypothetical protein